MKTVDISGMGGSYEAGCQEMLRNGLKYLKAHPDFDFSVYKSSEQVFGLVIAEGEAAKDLDKAIIGDLDATGAMHHAVLNHLAYIHTHSYDQWLQELANHGRELIEAKTDDELDDEILIGEIEWQLKLAKGYDPAAEFFKSIPKENIIEVDINDPDSLNKAAEKIAKLLKSK